MSGTVNAAPAGPAVSTYKLRGRDEEITIVARRLGHGSSFRAGKLRWFEVDIYRQDDGEYVVHTRGMTLVADETTYTRILRTRSAFEIVDALIVNHRDKIYLPQQSTRALAQAAQWDDDCLEAYREAPTILAAKQSRPVESS
jgi:hypothetical protein